MLANTNSKKIQNRPSLPKSTLDSIQQLNTWDQQLHGQKDKVYQNKHQYQPNGGSVLLQSMNTKKNSGVQQYTQQMHSNSSIMNNNTAQPDIRAQLQKRKLEQAREDDRKLKTSKNYKDTTNTTTITNHINDHLDQSQEASDEYEVEKIIDKKLENGAILYKVKWKGWDSKYNTWEPEHNLFRVSEMIEEYEASKKYLKKGQFNKSVESSNSDLEVVEEHPSCSQRAIQQTHYQIQQKNIGSQQSQQNQQNSQQLQKAQSSIIKNKPIQNNSQFNLNGKGQQASTSTKDNLLPTKQMTSNQLSNVQAELYQHLKPLKTSTEQSKQFYEVLLSQPSISQQSQKFSHQIEKELSPISKLPEKKNNPIQMELEDEEDYIRLRDEELAHLRDVSKKKNKPVVEVQEEEEEDAIEEAAADNQDNDDDDDKEYIFEAILDKRQLPGQEIEYLLKFSNHETPEWEFISNLVSIDQEISQFEKELLSKKFDSFKTKKGVEDKSQILSEEQQGQKNQPADSQRDTKSNNINNNNSINNNTDAITSATTIHSTAVEKNKQSANNFNKESKQTRQSQPKPEPQKVNIPEQISIDGSEDQFEKEVIAEQQKNSNQPQSRPCSQPGSKKDRNKSQTGVQQILKDQSQNQLTNQISKTISLDSQISNNLVNPLQFQGFLALPSQLNNPSFPQEMGCYYKGDSRYLVEMYDKPQLNDLNKATFKIIWKPRQNGYIPLPSLVSYQLLKHHDPQGLVAYYESVLCQNNQNTSQIQQYQLIS